MKKKPGVAGRAPLWGVGAYFVDRDARSARLYPRNSVAGGGGPLSHRQFFHKTSDRVFRKIFGSASPETDADSSGSGCKSNAFRDRFTAIKCMHKGSGKRIPCACCIDDSTLRYSRETGLNCGIGVITSLPAKLDDDMRSATVKQNAGNPRRRLFARQKRAFLIIAELPVHVRQDIFEV